MLDLQPGASGRLLDRARQLFTIHRPDQHVTAAQQLSEPGIRGEAAVEIRPQRHHDERSPLGVARRRDQLLEERRTLLLALTQREQLLQLVDRDHDPLTRRQLREHLSRDNRHRARARARALGCSPGRSSSWRHPALPGNTPALSAGSTPARSSEDLPMPDGPRIPTSVDSTSRASRSDTSRSRPQKYSASARSKHASPLNGQTSSESALPAVIAHGTPSSEGSCSRIERSSSCSARPGSSPSSSRSSSLVSR